MQDVLAHMFSWKFSFESLNDLCSYWNGRIVLIFVS